MSEQILENGTQQLESGLSRRDVLRGAVAATVAMAMASGNASAAHDHDHHAMHRNDALIDAAADCTRHGEICLGHCLHMFKTGDTTLAKCADSVNEMLVMCAALTRMAASDASRLAQVAQVCRDVCDDCEKQCRKHEDEHPECKACAESCAKCIKECDKVIA
jgi:Cys-rich four helix bundle protein (predicted Tat secretion target)